jgi:hypothetical protein
MWSCYPRGSGNWGEGNGFPRVWRCRMYPRSGLGIRCPGTPRRNPRTGSGRGSESVMASMRPQQSAADAQCSQRYPRRISCVVVRDDAAAQGAGLFPDSCLAAAGTGFAPLAGIARCARRHSLTYYQRAESHQRRGAQKAIERTLDAGCATPHGRCFSGRFLFVHELSFA